MVDKRRVKRLKNDEEITLTVFADGKIFPKEIFFNNYSKDISLLGVRIKTDIYLPPGSFVRAEMKFNSKYPMIAVIGQVKWSSVIEGENIYEAGLEFFAPPNETIRNLEEYVCWLNEMQSQEIIE